MPDPAFYCVVCGKKMRISAEPAGGVVECPHCLRVVPVPVFGPALDYLGCAQPALPPEILSVEMKFLCAACDAKLSIDVRLQDRQSTCPKCRASIRVPRLRAEKRAASAELPRAAAPMLSLEETEFLSGGTHVSQKIAAAG